MNEKECSEIEGKAREYFELGLNVVPVKGKMPLISWKEWEEKRQSEEDFSSFPWNEADGFAVIGGQKTRNNDYLGAVDYDVKNLSPEIVENGRKIICKLPKTRVEKTPSGGLHHLYLSKKPVRTNAQHRSSSSLELLGENKLIVMAPSNGYSVVDDFEIAVVDDLENIFAEIVKPTGTQDETQTASQLDAKIIKRKRYRGPDPPCIKSLRKGVSEGKRNESAIRLASYLRNYKGIGKKITLEILKYWNSKNSPPLSEKELKRILNSADEKGYVYSCKDPILSANCTNKETCPVVSAKESDEFQFEPSVELPNGVLVEQGFDGEKVYFLKYDSKSREVTVEDKVENGGVTILPIDNSDVRTGTVLLPTEATEYGTIEDLIKSIGDYVDKWYEEPDETSKLLDLFYILLTYLQDLLPQVPYRSMLGDFGMGKSRWLAVIGSICYRPIRMNGSDTDISFVRKMHVWRGTAILDEADFSRSDLYSFIIKVLNCGFDQNTGWYQRACEDDVLKTIAYSVFGCKLLARRGRYRDLALESRCLTSIGRENIKEFPMYLLDSFNKETLELRNKLLLWRFKNYSGFKERRKHLEDRNLSREVFGDANEAKDISNRVKQMLVPLWLIAGDSIKPQLTQIARAITADLRAQDPKYKLELEAKDAIKCLWLADQRAMEMQINDADRGIAERGGAGIRKAETRLSLLKVGETVFVTVSLGEVSKMILKQKGVKADKIERKDIIAYSKSLKTLFESKFGFKFRIGAKHERIVLIPREWFVNLIKSKSRIDEECLNVKNVDNIESKNQKEEIASYDERKDTDSSDSEHSIHSNIQNVENLNNETSPPEVRQQEADERPNEQQSLAKLSAEIFIEPSCSSFREILGETKTELEDKPKERKPAEEKVICFRCGEEIPKLAPRFPIPPFSEKRFLHEGCYIEFWKESGHVDKNQ